MIKNINLLLCCLLIPVLLVVCVYPDIVERFGNTEAYELAKAVHDGDVNNIKEIVKQDPELMKIPSSSGINVLILAIYLEEYEAFKTLLEFGANPNYRNHINYYTPLIESIRPFGSASEWRTDYRYQRELLRHGADPNLRVDSSFTNSQGKWVTATSPAFKASAFSLKSLQILLEYNVDYKHRIEGRIPFGKSVSAAKFEIINYYIDSLEVDVHQPMYIRSTDSLFIQDYINRYMSYKEGSEGYEKKQALIKKLKNKGVDFDNYEYKF